LREIEENQVCRGVSSCKSWKLSVQPVFQHRIKGFVIPTKSFDKIGMAKIFCYNNKMFSSISAKRLVAAAKFLIAATKKIFVVPNFVALTKPFFPRLQNVPTKRKM